MEWHVVMWFGCHSSETNTMCFPAAKNFPKGWVSWVVVVVAMVLVVVVVVCGV